MSELKMENGKKPIYPQSSEWQNDMEKHISMPEKYGHPSFEGIGLTKREHFAAMAMQGLLTNYFNKGQYSNHVDYPMVSEIAVRCAEDLLEELNK